jgi:hypothetical protein
LCLDDEDGQLTEYWGVCQNWPTVGMMEKEINKKKTFGFFPNWI